MKRSAFVTLAVGIALASLVPVAEAGSPSPKQLRGSIVALESATGKQLWRVRPDAGGMYYDPFLDGNLVYAPSYTSDCGSGPFVALDKRSGAKQWHASSRFYPVDDRATGGTVVVGDGRAHVLRGLASRSGKRRWETTYEPSAGPPLGGPTLVFTSPGAPLAQENGVPVARLDAIDRATGAPRWTFRTTEQIDTLLGSLIVLHSDPRSTLVFNNPYVYRVLDTNTGSERFRFQTPNRADLVAVVGPSVVYVEGTSLMAVDVESGATLWRTDVANQHVVASSTDDDAVFVSNRLGPSPTLTAFDAKTGAQRWAVETGVSARDVSGAGHGIVLLQSTTNVVALNARDGAEQWRVPLATNGLTVEPSFGAGVVVLGVGSDLLCR